MEDLELLDIIYEGHNFDDPGHLNSLYQAFRDSAAETGDSKLYEPNEMERIRAIKASFRWLPVPQHYLTRFQKSPEMSTSLRERGNKELHSNTDSSLTLALRGYNLAIAFAPLNSPELALALEKRAELLIRLEEPELAQMDIHAVSKITSYPTKSAQKLIQLQNKSIAMGYAKDAKMKQGLKITGGEQDRYKKEAKKYTEDQFFSLKSKNPCVSNVSECTEIDYKPHCGRRVVATRYVQPGEVLMMDEPYALILEKMMKWDLDHCTNCSKPILAGIPCNSCTFGWFCSKTCLDKSARGMHKYEHNYLSYLKCGQIMSIKGLLACRILFKVGPEELYRIFSSQDSLYFNSTSSGTDSTTSDFDPRYQGYTQDGIYSSESYLPIYHLISHPHVNILKSKANSFKALVLTNLIEDTSNFFNRLKFNEDFPEFKDFISSLLLRHMESIDYNAITLSQLVPGQDGQPQPLRYGAGVYPVLSLINHSCDPNCVPVRSLRLLKTAVVAMKTLKPGDEITFSYAPHFSQMEPEDRLKFLFDKYNFKCGCEACVSCWGPLSRSFYVAESQCNTCSKYSLTGQCPKCTRKDAEIRTDLVVFGDHVGLIKDLLAKGRLIEAMELVKPCLQFASDEETFCSNFALGLEFQEIFKLILVALVNL